MAASTTPTNNLAETATQFLDKLTMDRLIAIAILALAVIFALVLHSLFYRFAPSASGKKRAGLVFKILRKTRTVSRLAIIILAVELTLPFIQMPEDWTQLTSQIITLVLIGLCGWLVNQLLHAATDARMARYDLDAEDNLEARRVATRMKVLRQMSTMLILLVTVGSMLMTFPSVRSIGLSLFASAGVAGIVIGFAAQPVLSNLLAGIQIALTQPIRIGDAVIMEGEWGWIEEITSTYVVVKIWDWRRLVIPLTQVIQQPFQNWTRETASIIGNVVWFLDYTAPVAEMRVKLKEFLDESELWDGDVQVLQVIDTTQETMQVRALMSAKNSPTAWDLRCEIREKMIRWLQENHSGALPRRRGQIQMDGSEIELQTGDDLYEEDSGMSDKIGHPENDDDLPPEKQPAAQS
ncbi:MAG: mechanosensitive ion channel protein MscS [Ponticaulis sp.]|nr:mechanosensitive ion channel protein MscS [Ponticaulis sp.]|tara:strand:- start:9922 stop:11145 length:1224 start_codon:yes stop_codon:yes gene_type:complete